MGTGGGGGLWRWRRGEGGGYFYVTMLSMNDVSDMLVCI